MYKFQISSGARAAAAAGVRQELQKVVVHAAGADRRALLRVNRILNYYQILNRVVSQPFPAIMKSRDFFSCPLPDCLKSPLFFFANIFRHYEIARFRASFPITGNRL